MNAAPRLGVCSWSLQPSSPADLVAKLREIGVDACQLALDPLREGAWKLAETRDALRAAGIEIRSGMMGTHGEDYSTLDTIRVTGGVRPNEHWAKNLAIAREDARIAAELGLPLVTFHAGFLPHERNDPERAVLLERLRTVVDLYAERGVNVAFETGQEDADTLLAFLADLGRPRAGVNFDPANMLLYDMGEPVSALEKLAPHVRQVHIKDAVRTKVKGQWGAEVRVGTGEVAWDKFFAVLARRGVQVDLMIEREAGDQRVADIKAARALVAMLTPAPRTIGVGVIGLGFMGRTHINAFAAANAAGFANKLVAVCDKSPERRAGRASAAGNIATGGAGEQLFDPREVRGYEDAAQLFADPAVELVSICTHTSTHVELAKAALEAGKHVLLEKPVALDSASIEQLLEVARRAKGLCMPAMCIRFWPAWAWLKRAIASGEYGAVKSAVFRRLGSRPQWAADFYANNTASGGALFDLHVHDVDFATWCLGAPRFVSAAGSQDHVSALYHYESGPQHVVVEGGWDHSPGWSFKMAYTVVFERATADYEFGRAHELVLARDGASTPVALDTHSGYDGEVRHLLSALASGSRELDATLEDALLHTRVIEAERKSLGVRQPVMVRR
jgi:predicted dehydrogenase/sugar phosphate isomerase/epimerase